MSPLRITAYTTISALGHGVAAMREALHAQRSGLTPCTFEPRLDTYAGMAEGLETIVLPTELKAFDCRNNRLAQAALMQDDFVEAVVSARTRYGADRLGVILGTSTSGIHQTELAYAQRDPETGALPEDYNFVETHNLYATTDFVRRYLRLAGPASMVSTACSSAAKAFASAWRFMATGLCDAAIVGGVDSLTMNTLFGFSSLELVSKSPCRPCAPDRNGISIGEAAGFCLLEWPDRAPDHAGLALLGYGESSDAYHMSTPQPEGEGAALAMERALQCANVKPVAIDYVNMHGTASVVNDSMEDKAITRVLGTKTPCSATKGFTGHTLGTSGITEAVICWLAMEDGFIPGTVNTGIVDPDFSSWILLRNKEAALQTTMSNSFGFGGSNCSLIFGGLNK